MTDQQRAAAERGGVDVTVAEEVLIGMRELAKNGVRPDCESVLTLLDAYDQATARVKELEHLRVSQRMTVDRVLAQRDEVRVKNEILESALHTTLEDRNQATARVAGLTEALEQEWRAAHTQLCEWASPTSAPRFCHGRDCYYPKPAALAPTPSAPAWHGPPNGETGFLRASDGVGEGAVMEQECKARIWHGPGHQSSTPCERRGSHDLHSARYGEFNQDAEWRGDKVFSGYFDEAPPS